MFATNTNTLARGLLKDFGCIWNVKEGQGIRLGLPVTLLATSQENY
jgi:hypothetical protein